MADIPKVWLVGRLGLTVGDGSDPDTDPDVVWCSEGTVRFIPVNTYTKVPAGTPVPFSAGNASIDVPVDSSGFLAWGGARYVPMLDLTTDAVNPPVAAGKATHQVQFRSIKADPGDGNKVAVSFPSTTIRIAGDNTVALSDVQAAAYGLESGSVAVDITKALPVPAAGGTPITVGPAGVGIVALAVDGSTLKATMTNGNELTTDLPAPMLDDRALVRSTVTDDIGDATSDIGSALNAATAAKVSADSDDPATPIGEAFAGRVSVVGRPVNTADYNAADHGGSVAAAINAAIAAARAASGNVVELPPGVITLDAGLSDKTSGNVPGLELRGASRGTKLQANFDNGSILTLDGSGVNTQFQRGGKLTNITFTQAGGRVGVSGLSATATWWLGMENVDFDTLSSDGVLIPNRSDISTNPDDWSSVAWNLDRVRFAFCGGFGIDAPAGLGWSGSIRRSYFSSCSSGGIYAGGHGLKVEGSSFVACGQSTGKGAVFQDYIGSNTAYGLDIEGCEFDGNYGTQINIVAGVGFGLLRNRFISRADDSNSAYRDPVIVQLGEGTGNRLVTQGLIRNNILRQDSVASGWASTWLRFGSASAVYIDEYDTRYEAISTALIKRSGVTVAAAQNHAAYSELGGFLRQRFVDSGALPAAGATYRGQIRMVQGASGTADRFVICRKDASDAYAWADLF